MRIQAKPLLAAALAVSLLLSGCVGTQGDADLQEQNAAGQAELSVVLTAENVGDVQHLGFETASVLAHDANVSLPDGFHQLSVQGAHADLVHDGEADQVELASGTVPPGTYDQILFEADKATVETGGSSGGGHGGDGHDHDHGDANSSEEKAANGSTTTAESIAVPLNVTFEATAEAPTQITFALDVAESFDGESFSPVFSQADVVQGNETVTTETDLETRSGPSSLDTPNDPPAPRIEVYAPNGDKVLEPAFDPEDGKFANSVSSGFAAGERVQFSATQSEAVAQGAVIEDYSWELGDGTTTSGQTAAHSYENPGVYEVTLQVTDTYGNVDDHTVRVVVVGWTQTVAASDFADDSNWTQQSGDAEANEWRLASPGYEDEQAWHVGASEEASQTGAGYAPTNEPVRLLSPEYEIPESFSIAGYELFVDGYASSGQLELLLHTEDGTETLNVVNGEVEWERHGGMDVLEDVAGKTVQFEAVFTADADPMAEGPGYAIDGFTLAGMAEEDMVNHELLSEASGGHDHGDHEH